MTIISIFSGLVKHQEWYEIALCDSQIYECDMFLLKKMYYKGGTKIEFYSYIYHPIPLPLPKTEHVNVNLVAS